jgi:hypothetical protein
VGAFTFLLNVAGAFTVGRREAYDHLRDPGRIRDAVEHDGLFEGRAPLQDWADETAHLLGGVDGAGPRRDSSCA